MAVVIKRLNQQKCVIKRILKFENYKNCLQDNKIILKSQQRFNSEAHNVLTEEINKIELSSNDDKRLQNFDGIESYPYGANVGKIYKTELLNAISKIKRLMLIMLQLKTEKAIYSRSSIQSISNTWLWIRKNKLLI